MSEVLKIPEPDPALDGKALEVVDALRAGNIDVFIAWDDEQRAEIEKMEGMASLHANVMHIVTKARILFQAGMLAEARDECENAMAVGGNDTDGSTAYEDALVLLYRIKDAEDRQFNKKE